MNLNFFNNSRTENKPLGSAGDITINELINKGLVVIDTPLVQMIRDNVDISVVGGIISSAVLYKAVMKMYMKATDGPNVNPNPLKGTKVFVNVLDSTGSGSTGSEGSNSASSGISNSSFFFFLNKLPS